MNGPFPSHWAEKIYLLDLALFVSFTFSFHFCLRPIFEWFLSHFIDRFRQSSVESLPLPVRLIAILFPVKNFSYNSSPWQFVTLNIWIGSNFFGYFVSFMSSSFRFCLIPVFEWFFCKLYWFEIFESVKTICNEEVQYKCEFISRICIQFSFSEKAPKICAIFLMVLQFIK